MIQWFEGLGLLGQICLIFAVPSSLVLVIQIILSLIGLGDDGLDLPADDIDVPDLPDDTTDLSGADLDGFHMFSARTVISFFVAFGWMGVSLSATDMAPWAVVMVSLLFGGVIMALVALMLYGIYKLQSDGTADNRNCLGTAGTVYMTVPAERSGKGKVNVMLQGSYVERDAVTDDQTPLPYGTEVVVVGVSGENTLIVAKK